MFRTLALDDDDDEDALRAEAFLVELRDALGFPIGVPLQSKSDFQTAFASVDWIGCLDLGTTDFGAVCGNACDCFAFSARGMESRDSVSFF